MKRTDLIRTIRKQAKAAGVSFELMREGANHEVWQIGGAQVMIPRHRELNAYTARGILADVERELGGK